MHVAGSYCLEIVCMVFTCHVVKCMVPHFMGTHGTSACQFLCFLARQQGTQVHASWVAILFMVSLCWPPCNPL